MNTTDKFSVIAGLHGNEPIPVFAALQAGYTPIIGNPRALAEGRRFIEKDLNACFGLTGTSYEENRAVELLALLPKDKPIVDFHTFSCESEPFAVITKDEMLPLAKQTGVRHVVIMRFNIKAGHSLCDARPCVSVEVGQHNTFFAFEETLRVLAALARGERFMPKIYEVFDIINDPGEYQNFSLCSQGFIPVLAGEKAYAHHGLKARRL